MKEALRGRIIAMHGGLLHVAVGDRVLLMSARRNLSWEGGRPDASRLVVGDLVHVELLPEEGQGVVTGVCRRRNALLRRAPGRSGRAHVLAANVDLALLVFAARKPAPSRGLLDRFLVGCSLAEIEAVIVINKIDQGMEAVEDWLGIYEKLEIPVYRVSARTRRGIGALKRLLKGKTSLFCGPSGAGKSSLLNAVAPGLKLKMGELSESSGKGRHTTSRAELLRIPDGGFVIDTPGVREFGLWQLDPVRLQQAFREIDERAMGCRYSGCSHSHEPDCAVRRAVEAGEIDAGRYRSYLSLLGDISED